MSQKNLIIHFKIAGPLIYPPIEATFTWPLDEKPDLPDNNTVPQDDALKENS